MKVKDFVHSYMQFGTKLMMVKSWRPEIEEATVYRKSVMIAENIYYASTDYDVQWFGDRFDKSDMDENLPYLEILEWDYDSDKWVDIYEQVEEFLHGKYETWDEFMQRSIRTRGEA